MMKMWVVVVGIIIAIYLCGMLMQQVTATGPGIVNEAPNDPPMLDISTVAENDEDAELINYVYSQSKETRVN